jgi:hypothetical protein
LKAYNSRESVSSKGGEEARGLEPSTSKDAGEKTVSKRDVYPGTILFDTIRNKRKID